MNSPQLPYPRACFSVEELNAATEFDGKPQGMLPLSPLCEGLAESLIEQSPEPEMVLDRVQKEDGKWTFDPPLSVSVYRPPNSQMSCVVAVEAYDEEGDRWLVDYYQLPYSEIVPRATALLTKYKETPDKRYLITTLDNVQIDGWLSASDAILLSEGVRKEMNRDGVLDELRADGGSIHF